MALNTGTQAPDFTLKTKSDQGLSDVTLSHQFGKKNTVLLFFPLVFTSVCTTEMCSVTETLDQYGALDATVYGISVDSPFAQEAWAQKNNIGITLLSDFNRTVAAAYDVLYEELIGFKGVAKRSAFVVNKDGVITYAWSTEDPHNLPDFEAIQAALKA